MYVEKNLFLVMIIVIILLFMVSFFLLVSNTNLQRTTVQINNKAYDLQRDMIDIIKTDYNIDLKNYFKKDSNILWISKYGNFGIFDHSDFDLVSNDWELK